MKGLKITGLIIFWAVLAACQRATLMQYQPKTMGEAEALKVVERVLREQPGDYAPTELTIDDEHFIMKRNRRVPVSIYYDSVGEVRVFDHPESAIIHIMEKGGRRMLAIYVARMSQAYLFADAMQSLKGSDK